MKKKVHPSPPQAHKDAVSVLKILPLAIATLSAALLPEEQEVLAYLIACSCSCSSSLPMHHKTTKPKNKRKHSSTTMHTPVFDCRCFECYMSFWSRWDASSNRDLIHKAIDLFDDHMAATATNTHKGDSIITTQVQVNSSGTLSHRQKQQPTAHKSNCNKSNCNDVKGEGVLQVGFSKEEGKIKSSLPVSRPSTHDDYHHRNGMAGRGLMRRMFPNIMGFLAEHLWTVWSPPV